MVAGQRRRGRNNLTGKGTRLLPSVWWSCVRSSANLRKESLRERGCQSFCAHSPILTQAADVLDWILCTV
ncbi:hypothetical protein BDV26DRAFT_254217, partial [Aspergillus bertholletiae]